MIANTQRQPCISQSLRRGVALGEIIGAAESTRVAMMWQPDKAQLGTIIDMRTAGMGLDAIARALGVSAEDFQAWGNGLRIASYAAPAVAPPPAMLATPSLRIVAKRGVCIKVEVDLFEAHLTAARKTSARIYLPHLGLARQIPVGSASRDLPGRRRSKGQVAT